MHISLFSGEISYMQLLLITCILLFLSETLLLFCELGNTPKSQTLVYTDIFDTFYVMLCYVM
jgi:hypothetical protein